MRPGLSLILKVFSSAMAFIYAIAGMYLIFSDVAFLTLDRRYKIILGIVLLVYGLYRIYRSLKAKPVTNEN